MKRQDFLNKFQRYFALHYSPAFKRFTLHEKSYDEISKEIEEFELSSVSTKSYEWINKKIKECGINDREIKKISLNLSSINNIDSAQQYVESMKE